IALDPNEQRVIEEARARRLQSLAKRELWSLAAFTTAFVAGAAAMALFIPSERNPGLAATLVLIGAYAAAFGLEFEIGSRTALAAQFALEFAVTAARQWITLGVPPKLHLRAMTSVYVIDAGLAPVGLAVAFAAQSSPYGVLLALPLIGLLSIFARERRVRIDH